MYHQMLKVEKEVSRYRRSITNTRCASCWRARYAEMDQTHGVFGDCLSGLDVQRGDNCNRGHLILLQIGKMSLDIAVKGSNLPVYYQVPWFLRLLHQRAEPAVVRRPHSHRWAVGLTLAVEVETGESRGLLATTELERRRERELEPRQPSHFLLWVQLPILCVSR